MKAAYALALLPLLVSAQDSLTVASPDGQIVMRLAVILPPHPGAFLRIGYSVMFHGKPLINTSYLGFLIHNQEPLLGENLGLTASRSSKDDGFNALTGEFLQNGSIGRRITVEARVYNDGIAFRYNIPRTAALAELLIESEETEFRLPGDAIVVSTPDGPFRADIPGTGSLTISEVRIGNYPKLWGLDADGGNVYVTHLESKKGSLPVDGTSPLTTSWRVLAIANSGTAPAFSHKLN